MTERDEEGRPIATKNAGAFLSPFQGVPPVPSSVIDQRGASVEHPSEADVERRGAVIPEPAGRRLAAPLAWLIASGTAIAIWSIGYAGLALVLDATAWVADGRPATPGTGLLALLHDDVVRAAALVLLLALATGVGALWLPARGVRSWTLLVASAIVGALIVGTIVVALGAAAAAVVIACAIVFLALAYQSRPLRTPR